MLKTVYSRFRGGLLSLACTEGRYNNTPFVERLCPLCKSDIETEFHFLLVCQNLSQIRSKYISFIWYTYMYLSVDKFIYYFIIYTLQNNISQHILNAMKFCKQSLSIEWVWRMCHSMLYVHYLCMFVILACCLCYQRNKLLSVIQDTAVAY